jgi:hypothetical protein
MFPLPNYNTAATEAAIFPDHAVLFEVEAGKNSLVDSDPFTSTRSKNR